MKILITGNLGYNGTMVTKCLNAKGHETVGLDTHFYEACLHDMSGFVPKKQILKDIRRVTDGDLEGIDSIVHLAALSNDALGELNPALTEEINFRQTVRLAELGKRTGVKKFIYASSCSVYGISDPSKSATEESVVLPLTAYAKAKVNAESVLLGLVDDSFSVVILRNATMHGASPKLRLDLVVNNLVASAILFNKVTVLSDGSPWRPLLSIVDFAEIVALCLEKRPKHFIYNSGFNEENYQIKDIGRMVSELCGVPLEINPNKTPDERSYRVSFDRFENEFSYFKPRLPLKDSILELARAYRKNNLSPDDFFKEKYFRIKTLKSLLAGGKLTPELFWAEDL